MFGNFKNLSLYEEVLVLNSKTPSSDQNAILTDSEKVIKSFKGKIYNLDTWGIRSLGNPAAKKIQQGIYFHLVFSGETQVIEELRRKRSISDKVVYFHHEKLSEKIDPEVYIKNFKESLADSVKKEEERQIKFRNKKRERQSLSRN